jgi:hypothetical protein
MRGLARWVGEGLATRLLDLDLQVQSDSKGIGRPGRRGRLDASISKVRTEISCRIAARPMKMEMEELWQIFTLQQEP